LQSTTHSEERNDLAGQQDKPGQQQQQGPPAAAAAAAAAAARPQRAARATTTCSIGINGDNGVIVSGQWSNLGRMLTMPTVEMHTCAQHGVLFVGE
jgi:hypothetical protein